MKVIRTIIAVVFFAAAIVLGMLAAKSDNLILWLLGIACISVAIMIDDTSRGNREAQ